jgi:hypothetical protein
MPARVDRLDDLLDQFVKDLHVRTKATSYRCALRKFHASLGKNGLYGLKQSAIRRWLLVQLTDTPIRGVVHRAQLVTRFLDWLTKQKVIRVNPFAELRKRYECPSTAGIVRALVSADPSRALEALRPLPRFGSHLGPVMRNHIQRMRNLGFRYGHESEFLRLDRFLQERPGAAGGTTFQTDPRACRCRGVAGLETLASQDWQPRSEGFDAEWERHSSDCSRPAAHARRGSKEIPTFYIHPRTDRVIAQDSPRLPRSSGTLAASHVVHDVDAGILRRTSPRRDRTFETQRH